LCPWNRKEANGADVPEFSINSGEALLLAGMNCSKYMGREPLFEEENSETPSS
jgi:hypothetical protein